VLGITAKPTGWMSTRRRGSYCDRGPPHVCYNAEADSQATGTGTATA
jgi:hypothetical protein